MKNLLTFLSLLIGLEAETNIFLPINEKEWHVESCYQKACCDTIEAKSYQGGKFLIQKYEVTKKDFYLFAKKHYQQKDHLSKGVTIIFAKPPSTINELEPATMLSLDDMQAYCNSLGARLPTELEWMIAAGVIDGKLSRFANAEYPIVDADRYSEDILLEKKDSLWYMDKDALEITSQLEGIHSLVGMNGGVWEVTYSKADGVILKGGSRFQAQELELLDLRVRNRIEKKDLENYNHIGFRCIKDHS